MEYYIYKLFFKVPVHFGMGRLSGSAETVYADTLFSALCNEALQQGGEKLLHELYKLADNDKLLISDMMPYKTDKIGKNTDYYIPKPFVSLVYDKKGDSGLKKKFKNLKVIRLSDIDSYMSGTYVPPSEVSFGKSQMRHNVAVIPGDDSKPYNVGGYKFIDNEKEENGLYFISGVSDTDVLSMLDNLVDGLSLSGIGGKRSSGYGKFTVKRLNLDESFRKHFDHGYEKYMSLSISMCNAEEMESSLTGAGYELVARNGYVFSSTYADEAVKKRTVYCFRGGATFDRTFSGMVFDVSADGAHPVYRYAKPLFIGIR